MKQILIGGYHEPQSRGTCEQNNEFPTQLISIPSEEKGFLTDDQS